MNLITTTELRTKTSSLVASLLRGEEVDLIHRSKIIATFKPKSSEKKPLTRKDILGLIKIAKSINLPKLSDKEIEKRYRAQLLKKYGKGLS